MATGQVLDPCHVFNVFNGIGYWIEIKSLSFYSPSVTCDGLINLHFLFFWSVRADEEFNCFLFLFFLN